MSGADDYGSQGYPPDGHDAAGGEPAYELDGGPDQLDSPLLDDEDYAQSHVDAEIGDQFHDFGAPAEADQGHDGGHSPVVFSPNSVPGPSWLLGVDPFAEDDTALFDQATASHDGDPFVAALHADYAAPRRGRPNRRIRSHRCGMRRHPPGWPR